LLDPDNPGRLTKATVTGARDGRLLARVV